MDCAYVNNFNISDDDSFAVRLIGEISLFASDLLISDDDESGCSIVDDELIFRLDNSNNKPTFFSEYINDNLILNDLIPRKNAVSYEEPLIVNMMYNYTRNNMNDLFITPAIIFTPMQNRAKKDVRKVTLCIDLLLLVSTKITLHNLSKTFIGSVNRQISDFKKSYNFLHHYLSESKKTRLIALHYRIDTNLLTLIVPEEELKHEEGWRQQVSRELKLERCLQRAQSLYPPRDVLTKMTSNGMKLVSPHSAISTTFPESHTVQGRYTYHHYLQDGVDDKGWGCAYRSLQTIVSWYLWQGWSSTVSVPSHRDIQASLVSMRDKEASFIGSRAWIGSFEINLVLQDLLAVESRIISLTRGGDISGTYGQLAEHFDDGGAPVMIGGGQLAHTILGVSRDKAGKARFLVLDPHYLGNGASPPDVTVVVTKGWCAWKELSFWKDSLPYNLCLPGRPSVK